MTAFQLAQRFVGEIQELPGSADHPFIQWGHQLCGLGHAQPDETPWCSSFLNSICWLLELPRTKSARARSWLQIGIAVSLEEARPDYDVVVLKRAGSQAGPEVLHAPGHVGLFAGREAGMVLVLGGNQGNGVSVQRFPVKQLLGIRRLR